MNDKQLKSLIHNNNIPKFMIFIDENPYNISIYKNQIVKAIGLPLVYYGDIQEAVYEASSLLAEDCIYYIRIDASDKIISGKKNVASFESALSILKNINKYVIVVLTNKDKVPKQFLNDVVFFNKHDYNSLFSFAKQVCDMNKINLSNDRLNELIEKSNCDFGIVINVLAQLATMSQLGESIEDFEFCDYRKGDIFIMCDKILARDESAWEYFNLVKNDTVMIVFNLYRKAREKLKSTNSMYYANIMCICEHIFNGIASGDIKSEYALKYLMSSVFGMDI